MNTTTISIDKTQAAVAAEVLKALGHPIRLRILYVLTAGKMHVGGIAEQLDVAQAIASQQLRILRSAGLVAAETEDGRAYYRIIEPQLFQMLNCVQICVTKRVERGE
jgi:ArsR family transcriptional regulator